MFTSGATESNNLALKGLAEAYASRRPHFVTLVTEHKSVLDTLQAARARRAARSTMLPVQADGLVDLDRLREAVTVQHGRRQRHGANNEIGVLAPLTEIAAIAHEQGRAAAHRCGAGARARCRSTSTRSASIWRR